MAALWLVTLLGVSPAAESGAKSSVSQVSLSGKAVLLPEVLSRKGTTFDPGPIAGQVVVEGRDGTLTPLLSDDASRALFTDERLRDRPIEVVGRRLDFCPYVQVLTFKVEDHGRMRIPEYYCEICTISVRSPQTCPCCQGPMVLRMKPEGR